MAANKLGRPVKGDRVAMLARVPKTHRQVYEREADAAGLPLGDYVALCLARVHELDEPDYIHRNRNQEALPLGA